jgi:hypothetical protein
MLGYSGTNAGGHLVIRDSVFDHNRTGLAPNSLNNDDAPPPQDGRCPGSATRSCLIIEHNLIADNTPQANTSAATTARSEALTVSPHPPNDRQHPPRRVPCSQGRAAPARLGQPRDSLSPTGAPLPNRQAAPGLLPAPGPAGPAPSG